MSLSIPPEAPSGTPSVSQAPSAADPTTAGNAAMANADKKEVTSSTKINSMADLKSEAPDLYNKMMESIAMKICNGMKRHQDRLKRLMRDSGR